MQTKPTTNRYVADDLHANRLDCITLTVALRVSLLSNYHPLTGSTDTLERVQLIFIPLNVGPAESLVVFSRYDISQATATTTHTLTYTSELLEPVLVCVSAAAELKMLHFCLLAPAQINLGEHRLNCCVQASSSSSNLDEEVKQGHFWEEEKKKQKKAKEENNNSSNSQQQVWA